MDDRTVLLVMYAVLGGGAILLGRPLARNQVAPNGWYGFRIPSTMRDPAKWYAANAPLGRWLVAGGVMELFVSLGLYRVTAVSLDWYAWACLAAFSVPFAVGIVRGYRALKRVPAVN